MAARSIFVSYPLDKDKNPTGNIVNTITGTTDISGTKTWSIRQGADIDLPDVTIKLYKGVVEGEPIATDVIESSTGDRSYKFDDFAMYDEEGRLINYIVVEAPLAGFSSAKDSTGRNFTNTYNLSYTSITATKKWIDAGGHLRQSAGHDRPLPQRERKRREDTD